jgi:O-methyltransferase
MGAPERLYLDLMKKCLTNWIYSDSESFPYEPKKNPIKKGMAGLLKAKGLSVVRPQPADLNKRESGEDRSPVAHTMIGLKRLENIQSCVEEIIKSSVPGDLIETGVWRGGATIFMRAILKAYGIKDRVVWVADSFEGLPRPDARKYPHDADDTLHTSRELAIPLEKVKANFERYGLLDGQVRFLKGWFKDTLPAAPIERLALIRLDGDMYGSTMEALESLYPKLSKGGYVIIDDYGAMASCRKAVSDFRGSNGIKDEIIEIDWTGAYWRRSA